MFTYGPTGSTSALAWYRIGLVCWFSWGLSRIELDGPAFKMKHDSRVTPAGCVLRKLSINELPQLFNVLARNVSIVRPRALPTNEVEKIEPWQRRLFPMRPRLTYLWHVDGRNRLDFNKWIQVGLEYLESWSLWLGLKILFEMIPVVFFGIGAY